MISRFVSQNGVDKIFDITQLPITILFKIWKSEKEEEYNKIVSSFIAKDEFCIANFVAKMVDRNREGSYKIFCSLFDADVVYERVKDVKKEEVRGCNKKVGYFVRLFEGSKE